MHYFISPIQSLSSTPVVSFLVLYGAQHTHSIFRVLDILPSCKGNQCYYVDRAYVIVLVR